MKKAIVLMSLILILTTQITLGALSDNINISLSFENTSYIDEASHTTWTRYDNVININTTNGINDNYAWLYNTAGCIESDEIINDYGTTQDYTMNIWVYPTNNGGIQWILAQGLDGNNRGYINILANRSVEIWNRIASSNEIFDSSTTLQHDSWNMITTRWNNSNTEHSLYINGTKIGVTHDQLRLNPINNWKQLILKGNYESDGDYEDGCHNGNVGVTGIDEFSLFKEAKTDNEILQLWNNGVGGFYPLYGNVTTIALSIPEKTHYNSNTTLTINLTMNSTEIINCTTTIQWDGTNTTYTNNSINTTNTPTLNFTLK